MIKQRGVTLIGAIFVLIIVSLLAQYLVAIAGVQRKTSLLALQTARAYQVANASLEWGSFYIINNSVCPASSPTSFSRIPGFTTTLTCSHLGNYDEDGTLRNVFLLNAHSQHGNYGSTNYVSRTLEVVVHAP